MGTTPNPHDALFRRVFSDPETAAAELQHVLPTDVVRAADWATLRVHKGSWIDASLRSSHADLLCSVELAGRQAFIYVLVEHKSWPDPFTALQLLGYCVRVWRRFRRENPRAKKIPPIVPLVVHHSDTGWTPTTEFIHLVDIAPELQSSLVPFSPAFQFALDDLTVASEQELANRTMSALGRLALFCLKRTRHSSDVCRELRPWVGAMRAVLSAPSGADGLASVLSYIIEVADAGAVSTVQLETLLAAVGPEAKETQMPTLGEKLRQEARALGRANGLAEGLAKGLAEGRAKGLAEGLAEGRAEILIRVLTGRFGQLTAPMAQRVRDATPEQVELWVDRFLTAQSLADVFDEGGA